ncbi:MAG: hypothetical protein WC861_05020 [Candidatus Micrarchaeia archaeon]
MLGGNVRFLTTKSNFPAYRAFAKDNDFKRFKLLAREEVMLGVKQMFFDGLEKGAIAAKIGKKIEAKRSEMEILREQLASRHDVQEVRADYFKYIHSPASTAKSIRDTALVISTLFVAVYLESLAKHYFHMPRFAKATADVSLLTGLLLGFYRWLQPALLRSIIMDDATSPSKKSG